jgi:hypothetical protein
MRTTLAIGLAQAVQDAVNALASSGELGGIFGKAKLTWRAP